MQVGGLQPATLEEEQQQELKDKQSIYFVLESASLEVAKVGKNYALVNCDDHANFLRKHKKDPADYRPDICHQALMSILDSPLNKAGKVKGIYVHTVKNVLIQVNPRVRLPRTFRRFCGLMVQLLQKLSIRATNGPDKLLQCVKSDVTRHLPSDSHRVILSREAPKTQPIGDFCKQLPLSKPIVFIVGAFSHGHVDVGYADEHLCISEYPLSAAYCLMRITNALEEVTGIV